MSKLGNIRVRKNSGAIVGSRRLLNLIEGANVTLTVTDDNTGDEVDVTIAFAGGASSVWVDQFFPYVQGDSHKGTYAVGLMPDDIDTEVYQTFYIPNDIAVIDTAVVIIIPEGTGNLRWQCDTDFATCEEDFETHQDSVGATTTPVTIEEIECIDISAALTGASGGDVVGIQFIRTASHINDTVDAACYYVGILIRGSIGE